MWKVLYQYKEKLKLCRIGYGKMKAKEYTDKNSDKVLMGEKIKIYRKNSMAWCGINSSGQKQGHLAGWFAHGNEHSGFMKFV
jgi:hypothetical protein